jgi:hypothetical protein
MSAAAPQSVESSPSGVSTASPAAAAAAAALLPQNTGLLMRHSASGLNYCMFIYPGII